MKMIEIKDGAKTTFKWVKDDYDPEKEVKEDLVEGDITTTCRKWVGMMDIPHERWDAIFNHSQKNDPEEK